MKILIAAVNKCKNKAYKAIFDEYVKRNFAKINLKEIEVKDCGNKKQLEGEKLLSECQGYKIVALDSGGALLSSKDLAKKITNYQNLSISKIAFVIGGDEGLSDEVKQKADFILSFGKITLPHMMARIVLIEQLYRAFCINKGRPYHK